MLIIAELYILNLKTRQDQRPTISKKNGAGFTGLFLCIPWRKFLCYYLSSPKGPLAPLFPSISFLHSFPLSLTQINWSLPLNLFSVCLCLFLPLCLSLPPLLPLLSLSHLHRLTFPPHHSLSLSLALARSLSLSLSHTHKHTESETKKQ